MSLDNTPICTSIITAPRPKPTLLKSLYSFENAGFSKQDSMVFADGPLYISGIAYKINKKWLGNKANWMNALATMLIISESGQYPYPWLMICEDDIRWCPGAADALTHDLATIDWHPRIRCLSLYTPRRVTKGKPILRDGYHFEGMQMGSKTWGAQCYLFKREWAQELHDDQLFQKYFNDPAKDRNIDGIIGEVINNNGHVIAYRVPCLVEHTMGAGNSSLGYKPDRPDLLCDYYRGKP